MPGSIHFCSTRPSVPVADPKGFAPNYNARNMPSSQRARSEIHARKLMFKLRIRQFSAARSNPMLSVKTSLHRPPHNSIVANGMPELSLPSVFGRLQTLENALPDKFPLQRRYQSTHKPVRQVIAIPVFDDYAIINSATPARANILRHVQKADISVFLRNPLMHMQQHWRKSVFHLKRATAPENGGPPLTARQTVRHIKSRKWDVAQNNQTLAGCR